MHRIKTSCGLNVRSLKHNQKQGKSFLSFIYVFIPNSSALISATTYVLYFLFRSRKQKEPHYKVSLQIQFVFFSDVLAKWRGYESTKDLIFNKEANKINAL